MKKIIKALILAIILTFTLTSFCYADTSSTYVRVRVRSPRKLNEQANLKGYDNIYAYDISKSCDTPFAVFGEKIDVLLDTFYNSKYLLTDSNSDVYIGPYHLMLIDYTFDNYESAKSQADALSSSMGINCYPYYDGGSFYIYAGSYINSSSAEAKKGEVYQYGYNSQVVEGLNKNIAVYDSSNLIVLMYSNNYNIYFSSNNFDLGCSAIKLDNNTFRGMMAFTAGQAKLISINRVELESYLYGVIANEVVSSWPIEAIKAQVLAARTYAVANIKPNTATGYDLEDNQNSQVYGGYGSERESTNSAVDDTKGMMIYYDNQLITAYFHSSSGGRTENSENIWMTEVPYLRAVDDPFSNDAPYATWHKVATKDYIIKKLRDENPNVMDIYDITLSKVSENERVLECIISTNVGDITLKKENVRAVFGYEFLLSSWFTISTDCDVYIISADSSIANNTNSNTNNSGNSNGESSGDSSLDYLVDSNNDDEANKSDSTDDSSLGDLFSDSNEADNEATNSNSDTKTNNDNKRVSLTNKYCISASGISTISSNNIYIMSQNGVAQLANMSNEYYFDGKGWGHGIGMSQYGAKKMAEMGYTFEQILKYYYTGVEIK